MRFSKITRAMDKRYNVHTNSPYIARLGRQAVIIPKSKVIEVECGHPRKETVCGSQLVLQPNQETPWPEGLIIREQLIQIPCQDKGKIAVTVENLTDHDITLCGRTTLGWLYNVDQVSL
ncbi:hypothetical protein ATANTOWER_030271 [Ataeniobius toweri]|uniref:dUTPase-like domain-containing protein n=1 Tax=Ataeniobius toweri TaxID=208326 RepID=A0ABU7C489_9TELE|nr:hypothetical protein [Ataeniobius toweri]